MGQFNKPITFKVAVQINQSRSKLYTYVRACARLLWCFGTSKPVNFASSNSVFNRTHDKQIGLPPCGRSIFLSPLSNRHNWTPLSPITITNYIDRTN